MVQEQDFIVAISYKGYVIKQQIDGFYVNGINRGITLKAAQVFIDGLFQAFADSMRCPVRVTHSFTSDAATYAHPQTA